MAKKVVLVDKEKRLSQTKSKKRVGKKKITVVDKTVIGKLFSKSKKAKPKKLTKKQKQLRRQVIFSLILMVMTIILVAMTVVVVSLFRRQNIVSNLERVGVSQTTNTLQKDCDLDEMIDNLSACSVAVGSGELRRGSAFMVAPGFAITNFHVIVGIEEPFVNNYDQPHPVEVWAFDPTLDLALLKLPDGVDLPLCVLDEYGGELRPLTTLYAVGWPYGATGSATFTRGELSRYANFRDSRFLQVDINVSPGNSGGPIATACGVVGINTFRFQITHYDAFYQGFNMAIPNSIYLEWLEWAIENGREHELPLEFDDFDV